MSKRWESYCNKCSLCCYEKIYKDGQCVINLDRPCIFLDTKKRECRVYENRFKRNPLCKKMTLWSALFSDYLPSSCGYVRKFRKINFNGNFPVVEQSADLYNYFVE